MKDPLVQIGAWAVILFSILVWLVAAAIPLVLMVLACLWLFQQIHC